VYYTVIKHDEHLRHEGNQCRKHELQASVFYISGVFYHSDTRLRLLHLLFDIDFIRRRKTIKHAFSLFYTLIKHGFLTNQSLISITCKFISIAVKHPLLTLLRLNRLKYRATCTTPFRMICTWRKHRKNFLAKQLLNPKGCPERSPIVRKSDNKRLQFNGDLITYEELGVGCLWRTTQRNHDRSS